MIRLIISIATTRNTISSIDSDELVDDDDVVGELFVDDTVAVDGTPVTGAGCIDCGNAKEGNIVVGEIEVGFIVDLSNIRSCKWYNYKPNLVYLPIVHQLSSRHPQSSV